MKPSLIQQLCRSPLPSNVGIFETVVDNPDGERLLELTVLVSQAEFTVHKLNAALEYRKLPKDAKVLWWEDRLQALFDEAVVLGMPSTIECILDRRKLLQEMLANYAKQIRERQQLIETKAVALDSELQRLRKLCNEVHEAQINNSIAERKSRQQLAQSQARFNARQNNREKHETRDGSPGAWEPAGLARDSSPADPAQWLSRRNPW